MRRRHRKSEDEAEINITPMLDIVFIMLIFFIVTTSFVKEMGIQVNRPSNEPPKEIKKLSEVIPIKIFADGRIEIMQKTVDISAVRSAVEAGLAKDPETSVVVIADRESDSGILVQVVDQARVAGASKVSLAAQRSR